MDVSFIVYNTTNAEEGYLLKYEELEKPSLQLSAGRLAASRVQDSTPFTISLWSVINWNSLEKLWVASVHARLGIHPFPMRRNKDQRKRYFWYCFSLFLC